jgi:hypothetical protein
VVDELAEGGDILEQHLEGQILLSVVALERDKSLGERRDTVGVVLCVANAMVSGVLNGSMVALIFGIFLNPKAFELMPLDQGGVWVSPRVFTEFILDFTCILYDR